MKGAFVTAICGLLFSSTLADLPGGIIPASAFQVPSVDGITKSTLDSTNGLTNYFMDWINLFFAMSGLDSMGFYLDKNSEEGIALKTMIATFLTSMTGMSVTLANPVGAVVSYVTPLMTQTCDLFNDLKASAK